MRGGGRGTGECLWRTSLHPLLWCLAGQCWSMPSECMGGEGETVGEGKGRGGAREGPR